MPLGEMAVETPPAAVRHPPAAVRTRLRGELPLAAGIAVLAAAIVFSSRVRTAGFLIDDWSLYSAAQFPHAFGFDSAAGALADSAGSRIGAVLYWLFAFSLFGAHSRVDLVADVSFGIVMAVVLYFLLRELGFPRAAALGAMTISLVAPSLETVRFWVTPAGSQLCMAAFFAGLLVALRAFSAPPGRRRRLHAASLALYLASVIYAEVAVPLIAVAVLVYLTRAPFGRCLRRWLLDMVIVVATLAATAGFVGAKKGYVRLPHDQWPEHARMIADQALTIFTATLAPFASREVALIGLGVLAGAALALWLGSGTSAQARESLQRYSVAFGICVVAIVAAYSIYVPAMLYYEPLSFGPGSHINVAVAGPLAVAIVSVLTLAYVVLRELLALALRGRGPQALPRTAALVAVVALFASGTIDAIGDTRSDAHIWNLAAQADFRVLSAMKRELPTPKHGATVFTFGVAGTINGWIPVFWSNFELDNAIKVAYHRPDLSAYPVIDGDHTPNCLPSGFQVGAAAAPISPVAPYGSLYFLDVPSGRSLLVANAAACRAAMATFRPGPAQSTTLTWSV